MLYFFRTHWKVILSIALLLITVVALLVLYLNRPGTINITTESDAEIYVSTERGGEYKKIGTSKAKYSTSRVPVTVYVMVSKDSKKTLSSVLLSRGDNKIMELSLKDKVKSNKLYDGALSYVHVDDSVVQGILPDDYSIVNFRTDREEEMRLEFVGIPYLSKIVWYDTNNFVYRTFDKEVGLFKDSTDLSTSGLAKNISLIDDNNPDFEDYPAFYDMSKYPGKPLVLVSSLGVFVSDDMGVSVKQIVKPLSNTAETYGVFTTENNIFVYKQLEPADQEEHTSQKNKVAVIEYDYTGKLIKTLDIPGGSINNIVEKNNITYILTDSGLVTIKDGIVSDLPLYFNYIRDITVFKGKLLVLGDEGLWLVDNNSLYLMYGFEGGAVGLAESLSTSGNSLVFGSQLDPNGAGKSETFITSF